ncbi:MAG: hypothetical protein ACRDIZ_02355 [Actinomycetota bacterium]
MSWLDFRSCPGCGYDFATDGGQKGCHYYDCPYLPAELNVYCDQCRFNFFTGEGNAYCDDPETCAEGAEARSNVENMRAWRAEILATSGNR